MKYLLAAILYLNDFSTCFAHDSDGFYQEQEYTINPGYQYMAYPYL